LWFTGGERPLLGMMRLDGAGRASSAGPSFQGYGSPVTLPTCSDRWCEEDGWCPYWGRFAGSPLSGRAPSPAASSLSVAAWCCGRDVLCAVSLRRLLSPWVTLHMVVLAAPRWLCERRRALSALVDVWLWMLCEACCYCLARCMLQVGDALGESLYWQSCGGGGDGGATLEASFSLLGAHCRATSLATRGSRGENLIHCWARVVAPLALRPSWRRHC
jgi:hypothetical protein